MADEAKIVPADLLRVPFSKMRLDPDNERVDMGDMESLINSIREEGVKVVMDGYKAKEDGKDVVFIRDGSRRFKALEAIYDGGKGTDINAFVKTFDKRLVNKEQAIIERMLRNDGKPFTALELSASVCKLLAYNWDEKTIATKLGKSVQWVQNMAMLNAAPQQVKDLVNADRLSATLALQTVRKGDDAVSELLQKANEPAPDSRVNVARLWDGVTENNPKFIEASGDIVTNAPKGSLKRITAKSLNQETNSWKEFKEWAKFANPDQMDADAKPIFLFLCSIMNNEIKKDGFDRYFAKLEA